MSEDFDDISTPPVPEPAAPARATAPTYAHRAMRVKSDRTLRIGGRRYRPGELVDGDVPAANMDDVVPADPPTSTITTPDAT